MEQISKQERKQINSLKVKNMNSPFISSQQNYDITSSNNFGMTSPSSKSRAISKSKFSSQPQSQQPSPKIVENICNQVKYLIEGNLKSLTPANESGVTTEDFVRDKVIPMLIKMFFQPSLNADQNESKTNRLSGICKKLQSTVETRQQFREITNQQFDQSQEKRFFSADSFQGHENANKFYSSASCSFGKVNHDKIQTEHNSSSKNILEAQITEDLLNIIPKTICLTLILLKNQITKQYHCFSKIKQFTRLKQQSILKIISVLKTNQIKCCLKKFELNKREVIRECETQKIQDEKKRLRIKQVGLSCQIMAKIVKIHFKQRFRLFKQNSLTENKWLREWVRYAALKSPITVKTSIWRLKNYASQTQDIQETVQDKHQINDMSSVQQKSQMSNGLENKENPDPSSSQQSISSAEFDQMFQNQEQDQDYDFKQPKIECLQEVNNQEISSDKKYSCEEDEYLGTISEQDYSQGSIY